MQLLGIALAIVAAAFVIGFAIAVLHIMLIAAPAAMATSATVWAISKVRPVGVRSWASVRSHIDMNGGPNNHHWTHGDSLEAAADWSPIGAVAGCAILAQALVLTDDAGWLESVRFYLFSDESVVPAWLVATSVVIISISAAALVTSRCTWRASVAERRDAIWARYTIGPSMPIFTPVQAARIEEADQALARDLRGRADRSVDELLRVLLRRHAQSAIGPAELHNQGAINVIVERVNRWASRETDAARRLDVGLSAIFRSLPDDAHSRGSGDDRVGRFADAIAVGTRRFPIEDVADVVDELLDRISNATSSEACLAELDNARARLQAPSSPRPKETTA